MISNSVSTQEEKAFYVRNLSLISFDKIHLFQNIKCPFFFLFPGNSYSVSLNNIGSKIGSYQFYLSSISGGLILSILPIDVENPASYLSSDISYLAYPVHQFSNLSSLTYSFFFSNFILSILQIEALSEVRIQNSVFSSKNRQRNIGFNGY